MLRTAMPTTIVISDDEEEDKVCVSDASDSEPYLRAI